MNDYATFLQRKRHSVSDGGFAPDWIPDFLFPFQRDLVDWSLRRGRAAIFADCGMGKTPMQLVWAQNVLRRTNRPVLILTPLAVSSQTIREAEKFSIECRRIVAAPTVPGIYVANYEKLHHFDAADFSGVVLDESSILKSYDGARRLQITQFLRSVEYRLLCTATAAPNDYFELGTSSEALGYLGHMDMLNRFFKNDRNNSATGRAYGQALQWRFKGHAEGPFWRWVCSWARAIRMPSDLGYDNGDFALPPLVEREHLVEARRIRDGDLFALPAVGLREQREERRRTIEERCDRVASLADDGRQCLVWTHLNDEADTLEKIIPDAQQISGKHDDEVKEERFMAFASGQLRVLVTKPAIGAWGLNFQNCSHLTFFPSHSFEQYYQAIRRCWRFGQKLPVDVDIITTDGERDVLANLQRKAKAADAMFGRLIDNMRDGMSLSAALYGGQEARMPAWL